jgi:hypothetical protein
MRIETAFTMAILVLGRLPFALIEIICKTPRRWSARYLRPET